MLVTDFFTLPAEANKLEASVRSLYPIGGGDEPEDGLEALAYAIRSDWDSFPAAKHRNIIVLWTDAEAHPLGFGRQSRVYPKGMARDFAELTAWWGTRSNPGCIHNQSAKRLLLFTPCSGNWRDIAEMWDNTVLYPSAAGTHLRELEYSTILTCIANSI